MHRWISIKEREPETGSTIVSLTNWPNCCFEDNIAIWDYVPGQLKTMTHWLYLHPPRTLDSLITEL